MALFFSPLACRAATEQTLADPRFGTISVYSAREKQKGLVLLLSDVGGWDAAMKATAEAVADLDYVVAGLPTPVLEKALERMSEPCADLAEALSGLGHSLAAHFGVASGKAPIVLGFGSGAAFAYAALAQAPTAAFHAGISVDFCPTLPVSKNLCKGRTLETTSESSGLRLTPSADLGNNWFVFQSENICAPKAKDFVDRVRGAKWNAVEGKETDTTQRDKGRSELLGLLQWLDPDNASQVETQSDLHDLPLHQIPAAKGEAGPMAVMLSGDGGWAALDRNVAALLAERGIPLVGWDALSYFWKAKTPEQGAADLERVIRHYTHAWQKSEVILIGYSFGADVLPFMVSRLPPELRDKVKEVAFLGLGQEAAFEFHLTDWIGGASPARSRLTAPEVALIPWTRRLCIYGAEEENSGCPGLAAQGVTVVQVPGDHHFANDYARLVKHIVERFQQ